jgi:hypothetical protein
MWNSVYRSLASVRLALALLIIILICCVIGVTIVRGVEAGALIFGTLWFNGLLVLLVVNVAFCFFGRIWGRTVTMTSFGMILFHLSFVAMLGGIIYNSMFYFRGVMRLTEGETLLNGDLQSYDYAEHGRYFDLLKLKGETTLIKLHAGYKDEGSDKRAAYEVSVGEGNNKKQGILYITKSLEHNGFQYLNDREGYSLLILLHDKQGRELYGAHFPLQSIKVKDKNNNDAYLYTTGTRDGPGSIPYPQEPLKPLFELQTVFKPSLNMEKKRDGEVLFQVWPLNDENANTAVDPIAEGKSEVGKKIRAGDYYLSVTEVRYWVAMLVRYEPGKPIVLTSLWVGLSGMIITFIGRMARIRGQ